MTRTYAFTFIFCIAVLMSSEYFLLQEAFSGRRAPMLLVYSMGMIGSITFFLVIYKKFYKATQ